MLSCQTLCWSHDCRVGLEDMLKASLEGHSALRLGNAIHLSLQWRKKSEKLESASLGTDLMQYPCPQGIWELVQCLYNTRHLMGRGEGDPLQEADSRKGLNGMLWKRLLLW